MSYEGYTQNFCKNGHFYVNGDVYSGLDECPHCSAETAIYNPVSETNCDSYGIILAKDIDQFMITPEVRETCNLGHVHLTKPATYRIPTQNELEDIRMLYDDEHDLYHYIKDYCHKY